MNSSYLSGQYTQMPNTQGGSHLSGPQSVKLGAILSNYDPSSLSKDDAKNLVSDIRELGIQSRSGLGNALKSAGFDASEIISKADLEDKKSTPPPPPSGQDGPKGEVNRKALNLLSLFVEKFEGDDITAEDWDTFFTGLDEQGIDLSKPILDLRL